MVNPKPTRRAGRRLGRPRGLQVKAYSVRPRPQIGCFVLNKMLLLRDFKRCVVPQRDRDRDSPPLPHPSFLLLLQSSASLPKSSASSSNPSANRSWAKPSHRVATTSTGRGTTTTSSPGVVRLRLERMAGVGHRRPLLDALPRLAVLDRRPPRPHPRRKPGPPQSRHVRRRVVRSHIRFGAPLVPKARSERDGAEAAV